MRGEQNLVLWSGLQDLAVRTVALSASEWVLEFAVEELVVQPPSRSQTWLEMNISIF